jgi:hypothetical protein
MALILTVADLELHLQQTIGASLTSAAEASLQDAQDAVMNYCERGDVPWTAATLPMGVALIIKRIAGRLLANPQQRSSYSGPDGLTYTGGPVRLLTDDEREQLDPWKVSRKAVGSIRMGVASWMRAPTAAELAALPDQVVSFDANGGSGSMPSQAANVATALTSNEFTRAGFTFAGWRTATGILYEDEASYPFTGPVTLYARWTALPTYTVTFNANGGSGSMANQATNVATPLTVNSFTRAGFTFAGWNTAADGSGTAYANEASYPFTVSATLYAQWTAL